MLFLVFCVFDVVIDLLMGLLVDCICMWYGQFCLFLLWGVILFGIVCVLIFYMLDFFVQGKIIYVCVIYIFLILVYIFVNVLYCVMLGVIIVDLKECYVLQFWCFFLVVVGLFVISGIVLLLVSIIGKGDEQVGYFGVMCVLGLSGVVLFYVCFFMIKECYIFEVQLGLLVVKDFKLLLGNSQWCIMCVFKMMVICFNVVCGGVMFYFVKYVMDYLELVIQFLFYGSFVIMFGLFCFLCLLGCFDCVIVFKWIIVVYLLISLLIFVILVEYIVFIFVFNILFLFVFNIIMLLQWLMVFDVVDYEESCSGCCFDGLVFFIYLFSLKIGLVIGGVVVGWILVYVNYFVSSSVQLVEVFIIIKILFCVVLVVFYVGMFIMLLFYKFIDVCVEVISWQLIKYCVVQGEVVFDVVIVVFY